MPDHQQTFGFFEPNRAAPPRNESRSQSLIHDHQESFALLGRALPPLPKRATDLPDCVAQWYALPDGLSLLKEYSNSDSPVAPDQFELHTWGKKILATFLYENQGVCCWAFDLKGGDDPPVYVAFNPKSDRWHVCCSRFSTFVYTRLFDFRHWCHPALSTSEIGPELTVEMLRDLRRSCRRHPVTHGWPGKTQYRFSEDDRRFTLCRSKGQTDWYLSATTGASLALAIEKYRRVSGTAKGATRS